MSASTFDKPVRGEAIYLIFCASILMLTHVMVVVMARAAMRALPTNVKYMSITRKAA